MNNARPLRFAATAGTELVGTNPLKIIIYLISKALQSKTIFLTYIEWPDQTFVSCPIFPTAAYSGWALSQSQGD